MRKGVVYACSNLNFIGETIRSALSFAKYMPDIERHCFISPQLVDHCRDDFCSAFTKIISLERVEISHRPRFESMLLAELDRTIFLDGDTLLLAPVYELFEILDLFDIGATIAPPLFQPHAVENDVYGFLPKVSMAIPEWNAGLLVARNTTQFREFVKTWIDLFSRCIQRDYHFDQAALRSAIATSKLRVATLANVYNFRANIEQIVGGTVRILHAHGHLPEIAESINATPTLRHYVPDKMLIHGYRLTASLTSSPFAQASKDIENGNLHFTHDFLS
jgi:hypothetical protein